MVDLLPLAELLLDAPSESTFPRCAAMIWPDLYLGFDRSSERVVVRRANVANLLQSMRQAPGISETMWFSDHHLGI